MPSRARTRSRSALRAALAALALAAALPALAATYKWVDANGRTVYSDQPPPSGQKYEIVGAAPPPDNPNAVKEMALKDAEIRKAQKDRAEQATKAQQSRADAQKRAEICAQARAAVRTYQAAGDALLTTNEKGETVPLDPAEKARRLAEQQRLAKEYCAG
jgi:hypothetical protein